MNEPVWIVDDDSSIRWVLQKALQAANIACVSFENPEDDVIFLVFIIAASFSLFFVFVEFGR
jgi:DNA-binding NtrC family response regulator